MKRLFSLVALLSVAFAVKAQDLDANRVVCVVNGLEVKAPEYYRRMEYLPNVGKFYGDRFAEFPPGFMTLEVIITEKIVFQLAKSKNVMPTELEITAELERIKASNPNFVKQWTDSGRLMADLLNQIKYDLAQFKIVTQGINITDKDIEDHYAKNKEEFTIPKKVKLRVIAVETSDEMAKVDKALADGTPFDQVAKTYSKDITKAASGEYGFIPISQLANEVKDEVDKTKIKQTTKWITKNNVSIKFLVEDISPEKLLPLDEAARAATRKKLMLNKGQINNDINKMMLEARKSAKVEINNKDFADAYDKFIKNFIKQQEAKTGPGK